MDLLAPTHLLLLLTVSLIIFVRYNLAKRQRREKIELVFAEVNKRESIQPDLMRMPSARSTGSSNQGK
jgi:hypothetical protein